MIQINTATGYMLIPWQVVAMATVFLLALIAGISWFTHVIWRYISGKR